MPSRPERTVLGPPEQTQHLAHTATSYLGFRVDDVESSVDFYVKHLGMTTQTRLPDGSARLGWGSGHHVLDLIPAGEREAGLDHFGFEVADEGGLPWLRKRIAAAGYDIADLAPQAHGVTGFKVNDPDGNELHLHGPIDRFGERTADSGRRPLKYQHITFGTDDIDRLLAFYVDVLGFRISDRMNDAFVWVRSNRDHHTLAICNVGRRGGIDHYSYDLAEWEDFKAWCDRLSEGEVDVRWGPGRHGPGNNLFIMFDDPDGNHIELSAEMEKFWDDRVTYVPREWTVNNHTVNLWGGQPAPWRNDPGA